eukprot:TRINITY_DN20689_c0_g1_i2.p1 TRINITY_DN20689_c0_g1~~TRINITY_DN20689_c0_g1_i2.p1  ORF type:complete len:281 (+),score=78.15 TRINITY_DN20689_c0_g1_i2:60-845(+)
MLRSLVGSEMCIRASCRGFAANGADKVVVVDMNLEQAQRVASDIDGIAMKANCGQEMDLRRVIMAVEFEVGAIDVWVGNAGIPANGGVEVPNDEWERIMNVNVYQHVWVARHLFPLFQERGEGVYVTTASAAGLVTQVGSLPYAVTKHAAVSISEWLAISYADAGVRVHCICPQAVRSGFTEGSDGGVAGGDGMLEPATVADELLSCMDKRQFLVLPHPEVLTYFQRKASDYDRWLKGMQRLHQTFGKVMMRAPARSAAKL